MLKKLHMSLIFSNLVVSKQLSTIIVDMRNFVTKFGKILENGVYFYINSSSLSCRSICHSRT